MYIRDFTEAEWDEGIKSIYLLFFVFQEFISCPTVQKFFVVVSVPLPHKSFSHFLFFSFFFYYYYCFVFLFAIISGKKRKKIFTVLLK